MRLAIPAPHAKVGVSASRPGDLIGLLTKSSTHTPMQPESSLYRQPVLANIKCAAGHLKNGVRAMQATPRTAPEAQR